MKKITFLVYCSFLFSCALQKKELTPFIEVYKSDWIGNVYPEYISLKSRPNIFETYSPGIHTSFFGQWTLKNDTLLLIPKYEYYSRNSELIFSIITAKDSNVATIPHKYLVKKGYLIDITDYGIILPGYLNNQNSKTIYRRVTKK